MRRTFAWTVVLLFALAAAGQPEDAKRPTHVLLTPADLTWGEGPPALPKGGTAALISGDPGKPGPFTLRAKLPAGYRIPPHWHPTDENITVLSGTIAFGMGEKFVAAGMKDLPAGGYAVMPATMRHFVLAKTETVIQVSAMGPFVITYIDPADDPRGAPSSK